MTQYRKDLLVNGEVYHIYSRSISKYVIFNDEHEYNRMYQLLDLYRYRDFYYKLSQFNSLTNISQNEIIENLKIDRDLYVEIMAYCIMPTHIHLILKQVSKKGIEKYVARALNGYSRYFNVKHQRIGPLWSSRFKSVMVKNDNQLLHLTRYLHLNPTSIGLVDKPEKWIYSSYKEFIGLEQNEMCDYENVIDMTPKEYGKFVNNRKDYQRELSKIKSITFDNYSG